MNTIQLYKTGKQVAAILLLVMLIFPLKAQDIEGGGIDNPPVGGYTKAEKLYNALGYHEAIPVYEEYLQKHDSVRAMCQLGDCYRLTSNFSKAEYWYGKAMEKGGDIDPKYKLYYAQMLQANEKYEEAAKWYANYKQDVPEDKRADNQLKSSADYGKFLLTKNRYEIHNLSFNSPGYDFAPAWNKTGLIYSSSRDSAKAIGRQSTWTGTQFFDMFYVQGELTSFGKPKPMLGDAATKYHEANAAFTPDGKSVYFTRNNYYNGKTTTSGDKIIKLDIYKSESDSGNLKWTNDQKFEYNNDEYSVGHPALTPDGNTMYFVSDMPGGYGSTDIYVTQKDGDKWGTPQNLGSEINTEGYEMFPYVDKDSILYFASDGHGGLGGLDNFKVKQNVQTKKWGRLKNIGAPINSSSDDFGYIYGNDKSVGYFTSNRSGGKGLDDIYSFEDNGIDLEGIVVDAKTGEPICKSAVKMLVKPDNKEGGNSVTECDGYFTFPVIRNMDYCFEAGADGYISNNSVCATTKNVKPGETVFVKIPLMKSQEYALSVQVLGKTPQVQQEGKTPETQGKTPETQGKTPETQGKTPETQGKTPDTDEGKTPDLQDGKTPDLQDGKTPDLQDGKTPDLQDGKTPDTQDGKTPDMQDGKTPDTQDGKTPDLQDGKTPDTQDGKTPDLQDGKTPDTQDGKTPNLQDGKNPEDLGKSLEERGLRILPNSKVSITSQCEGWTKEYVTDDSGKICVVVRCDCDYTIVGNAKGYYPGTTFVIKDDGTCLIDMRCGVNPREVEVILDPIQDTGKYVELKDIYYDFDKWNIRTESEAQLKVLLGFLKENPDAIVEIASHTDARAPYDYNIRLSQKRAQSVVDWLVSHGVQRSRLKPKGYGETKPRNSCTDDVKCSEYEHQRNRRTEFRIVGGDIDIKSLERFDMQVDPCRVCPF